MAGESLHPHGGKHQVDLERRRRHRSCVLAPKCIWPDSFPLEGTCWLGKLDEYEGTLDSQPARTQQPRRTRLLVATRNRDDGGDIMKLLGVVSTTGLFLLLGIIAPAAALQEQQEQPAKPPKHEQQAKPEKQQDQAKGRQEQHQPKDESAKQEQQKQAKRHQDERRQQNDRPANQENQAKGQQEQEQKQRQQQDKSSREQEQAKAQQNQQRQQRDNGTRQEQQQQVKEQQDQTAIQEQQRTQQRDRPQEVSLSARQRQHGQENEQRGTWQERRAHSWESEHRDWGQRGGLHRLPHSGRSFPWPFWPRSRVPRLQSSSLGGWRVSPLSVRRLLVQFD